MKKTITILATLLVTAGALAQQTQKQTPPAPGTPRNFAVPEIRRFSLPNGLQVRFVPYGEVPKATVRLVVQTGNVDEQASETWLADVTGSMMEQGTTTRSAAQIAEQMAMMGGSLDIGVGMNQVTIGTDVFSESAADAVAVVADVARTPRFPEADLARIRTDLARNLSISRSQPQPLASEKFAQVLFPNHPYGRIYPTEQQLASYTLDQVRSFHQRNFGAGRAFVYVVGRFDANAVEAAIRRSLGDWNAGSAPSKVNMTPVGRRGI